MVSELFQDGQRKYINDNERKTFLEASKEFSSEIQAFCLVLAFTGCRISEALELTADRVDLQNQSITFRTLKKRREGIYRSVPLPPDVLEKICLVYNLRELHQKPNKAKKTRLFPWSRVTGYRYVKDVMEKAKIKGIQASPKGLRHGLGVTAVKKAPLNMAQKWLGHAKMTTTAIYANATGEEERELALKMWE